MSESAHKQLDLKPSIGDLAKTIRPIDYLLLSLASMSVNVALFRPTLVQFFVTYGLHSLIAFGFAAAEKPLFLRFFPRFALIFPDLDVARWAKLSAQDRAKAIEAGMAFPMVRARYTVYTSLVITFPSLLLMTFWWHRESSYLIQFLMASMTSSISFLFFFAAVWSEAHIFLSGRIAEMHRKLDLSSAFRLVGIAEGRNDFVNLEAVVLLFMWLSSIVLAACVWYRQSASSLLEMGLLSLLTLIMFTRMWYLGRRHFCDGLDSIVRQVSIMGPSDGHKLLPMHTIGSLAALEKAFNDLSDRTQSYQIELNHWITRQAEECRLNAMGELAGLVVHDLASPLHVIRMCTQQVLEETKVPELERFREPLLSSTDQAIELITSLRAYLRHDLEDNQIGIGTAVSHVRRILRVEYLCRGFDSIQWQVSPDSENVIPNVRPAELMQLLNNVLSNSVKNLLENKIAVPIVTISIASLEDEVAVLSLSDNGTGLSQERFETLTGMPQMSQMKELRGTAMGLRLVRRIVERHGGALWIADTETPGTTLMVRLPRVQ